MIIKKLVLHKFKRFFLTNVETITLTPENKISIILGSNGSGKSQLLSQLTPLAANLTKDYDTTGYKYIEILHKEDMFKLTSGIDGTKKHSFIVNDRELNQGGTITVQNTLVKEYFNITPHVQQVIIGNSTFTHMSPNERKRWITEISHIDYTYSVSVYNKMKQRHRDILGGIKLIQEDIVKTELNVLSEDEVNIYNEDVKYLELMIEHLTTLIDANINNNNDIDDKTLLNLVVKYRELYSRNEDILTTDVHALTTSKEILLNNIKNNKESIAKLSKDIDKITYIEKHDINKDTVIAKILSLSTLRDDYIKNMSINIPVDKIALVNEVFNNTYTDSISLLGDIKRLDSYDASDANINKVKQEYEVVLRKIHKLESHNEILRRESISMKNKEQDDNKITCVNCNHIWHLGYDKQYITDRSKLIEDNNKHIERLTKSKIATEDVLKHLEEKVIVISTLRSLLNNQVLREIWVELLKGLNIKYLDGNVIYNKYEDLNMEFKNRLSKIPEVDDEINKLNLLKKEIELKEQIAKDINTTNKDKLLTELSSLTNNNIELFKQVDKITKLISERTHIDKLVLDIGITTKRWYKNRNNYIISRRNDYLKELIHKLRLMLIEIVNKINKSKSVIAKLKVDKENLHIYKKKEKVLKIMLKELSPTEGLIAKSISSFLNMFLEDINKLINSIWNYDIKLLPSEISDDNDLDYKFQVMVDGREIIEDISKTSSSMQEVIDIAFRIMFIKYMRFEEYPLILDEFGRTFDAKHRISAYDIIDRIVSSKFSQIFMVSHFESMYGRFTNSDICVLSTTGVDLSNVIDYNKTLKIERY